MFQKSVEDNFGPIQIPAFGKTIDINLSNLPIYKKIIVDYENNSLETIGNQILINNTKVIKANLEGLNGSKKINFTLHMKKNSNNWFAFAKPAKKCNENDLIIFNNNFICR